MQQSMFNVVHGIWDMVYGLYIYKTILHVKNNIKKSNIYSQLHNYNTRDKNYFIFQKHNKEFFKK
jgi:hypothetical protein